MINRLIDVALRNRFIVVALYLARLRAEMGAAVQLPGISNIWTMPIINRLDAHDRDSLGSGSEDLRH